MGNFDDVWFTYKSRIAAELRLRNNDFHTQGVLVWYALLSSGASIAALRFPNFAGKHTDMYTAILSVALLVVSLFVANRDYRGRSMQMRANHIALKRLYDELSSSLIPAAQKPSLYGELLGQCENHTTYDYRYFRVFNHRGLKPAVSLGEICSVAWMLLLRIGGFGLLYAAPALVFLAA